jgi:Cu/Ag efflux pump CusA
MKQYLEKRSFSSWSIRHPLGSLAIISVIIVLGGFFYTTLTVDLLPRVVYPVVMAVVNYPGADPFVMEETVTKVLESRMATTEDVVEMRSDTREGRANVRMRFDYGKDIDIALRDASSQLDRARGGCRSISIPRLSSNSIRRSGRFLNSPFPPRKSIWSVSEGGLRKTSATIS